MRIWLFQVGEPLPLEGNTTRVYRTGLLANLLHQRGHEVHFWSTTFDHTAKRHTHAGYTIAKSAAGYDIHLLHGCAYTKNVSWQRIANHIQLTRDFERHSLGCALPDLLFCSMPTIELCHSVAQFAQRSDIPLVIDIRDLWPDIFMHKRGLAFRAIGYPAMMMFNHWLRAALRRANAITGVSEGYLNWGLRKAGRARRPMDRVFTLGYDGESSAAEPDLSTRAWFESLKLRENDLVCSFLGTFGRTYCVATIIESARNLHEAGERNYHFLLSGRGDEEPAMRERARGLPNVSFTGWLSKNQIAALMRRADVGLAAYAADAPQGLPNKIGEYACGGLAIVSSLGGEGAELLRRYDSALQFRPDRPDELVAALRILAGDPARLRTLRSNSRRLYVEHFDARSIYTSMAEHLEACAASARKS